MMESAGVTPSKVASYRHANHLPALDGLRGVAAIGVMVWHVAQMHAFGLADSPLYLAVDFFFLLSGYVVARAYDARLGADMTALDFAARRFARLYPMLFVGIVMGAMFFVGRQLQIHSGLARVGALLAALSLLMIPAGLFVGALPFLMNPPVWSLFFEILANVIYATRLRKITRKAGAVLLIVTFAALTACGFASGGISHLGDEGGWRFVGGIARVAFPFTAGVALSRSRRFAQHVRLSFWVIALGLSLILLVQAPLRLPYELVVIGVALPVVLILAVNATVGPFTGRICAWLGGISYPLYLSHQPILRFLEHVSARLPPVTFFTVAVVFTIVTAWILRMLIERPAVTALNSFFSITAKRASGYERVV